MPITTLDAKTALIVIDLQNGIVARETVHPVATVIANAAALASAFRAKGLPVVLVRVTATAPGRSDLSKGGAINIPEEFSKLVPELNQQPDDHIVEKRSWGAFVMTGLHDYLASKGVTQVVIVGISTSIGVESTARQAYEIGFNVTLALDAMTDTNADAHENSVTRIFPRLGETGSTQDIINMLNSRKS
ncbi:MAG: isochorismatase family protein [Parvibaculaceae bacterium]